jgi:hypothetical protein
MINFTFNSGDAVDDEIENFINDVQMAAMLVESVTCVFMEGAKNEKIIANQSIEEKYLTIMKDLQFGEFNLKIIIY